MNNLNSDFSHFVSGKEIERLGLVKDSCLRAYRASGSKNSPPYIRIDGHPRYNPDEIRAWVEARNKKRQNRKYIRKDQAEKQYSELLALYTKKYKESERQETSVTFMGLFLAAFAIIQALL